MHIQRQWPGDQVIIAALYETAIGFSVKALMKLQRSRIRRITGPGHTILGNQFCRKFSRNTHGVASLAFQADRGAPPIATLKTVKVLSGSCRIFKNPVIYSCLSCFSGCAAQGSTAPVNDK